MKFKPHWSLASIDCDSFAGQCYSSLVRSLRTASYSTQGPLNNSHRNKKSYFEFFFIKLIKSCLSFTLMSRANQVKKRWYCAVCHFVERTLSRALGRSEHKVTITSLGSWVCLTVFFWRTRWDSQLPHYGHLILSTEYLMCGLDISVLSPFNCDRQHT